MDIYYPNYNAITDIKVDNILIDYYTFLKTLDNEIYCNGEYNRFCGLRPLNCPIGAKNSPHKQGKALDLHLKDINKLRNLIEKSAAAYGITRVEEYLSTPTWVHIDIVPLNDGQLAKKERFKNGLYFFKP